MFVLTRGTILQSIRRELPNTFSKYFERVLLLKNCMTRSKNLGNWICFLEFLFYVPKIRFSNVSEWAAHFTTVMLDVHSTKKSNQRVYRSTKFDIPPPTPNQYTLKLKTVDDVVVEPARPVARGGSGHRPHAAPRFVGIPLSDRPIIDFVRGLTLNYWHRRAASIIAEISSLILAAAKLEILTIRTMYESQSSITDSIFERLAE